MGRAKLPDMATFQTATPSLQFRGTEAALHEDCGRGFERPLDFSTALLVRYTARIPLVGVCMSIRVPKPKNDIKRPCLGYLFFPTSPTATHVFQDKHVCFALRRLGRPSGSHPLCLSGCASSLARKKKVALNPSPEGCDQLSHYDATKPLTAWGTTIWAHGG